jgi:hypothetical protein
MYATVMESLENLLEGCKQLDILEPEEVEIDGYCYRSTRNEQSN